MSPPPPLPRSVRALGAVSFCNDAASDMIAPLMPRLIASLGAGPAALGLIEGVADATAALLKLYSGVLADRVGRLKALTVAGYLIANLVRPLLGLAGSWSHVLGLRFADRIGKGVRTTPRDRLLADSVPESLRGRAFGFHRAMDHAGATAGPLLALVALEGLGLDLQQVFLASAVPGLVGVLLLVFLVREPPAPARPAGRVPIGLPRVPAYRRFLCAALLFAAGTAPDAFLVWRTGELGLDARGVLLFWMALHVARSALAQVGGTLSDRHGRKATLMVAWTLSAAAAAGLALADRGWHVWAVLPVLGAAGGMMEGIEKALVVDLVPAEERGRGLGGYHAARGLAALPAAAAFGIAYQVLGAGWTFGAAAVLSSLAIVVLAGVRR